MTPSFPEPIEDLLSQSGRTPPSSESELRILNATCRLLAKRRRRRRLVLPLVGAACFLAGVGLTLALNPPPEPPARMPAPGPDVVVVHTVVGETKEDQPSAIEKTSPVDLEWQAFDSSDNRAQLYFQAGRRYLAHGDVAGAMRCYRQALDVAPPEERYVHPGDDWLLASLKNTRKDVARGQDRN